VFLEMAGAEAGEAKVQATAAATVAEKTGGALAVGAGPPAGGRGRMASRMGQKPTTRP
jgi:hypothetical protein